MILEYGYIGELQSSVRFCTWEYKIWQVTRKESVLHKLGCPGETAIEQLMEQYQLSQEIAAAKVNDLWQGSTL